MNRSVLSTVLALACTRADLPASRVPASSPPPTSGPTGPTSTTTTTTTTTTGTLCWPGTLPIRPESACTIVDGDEDFEGTIESPSEGAVVRSTWLPLAVALGERRRDGTVRTCLDGRTLDDPLGVVRRRTDSFGGGYDYLATLELADVAPGEHELLVEWTGPDGTRVVARSTFLWDRPAHRLDVTLVDEAGCPAWGRVVVTDGEALVDIGPPDDAAADPHDRDVGIHSFFVRNGLGTVYLDAGTYRLLTVRSLADELAVSEITLDADTRVSQQVATSVPLHDYVSADLHVHTGRSYDAHIPDRIRLTSLIAAGLDVAVVTDHGQVVELMPALDTLLGPVPTRLRLVAGIEADMRDFDRVAWDLGHLNAFPVVGPEEAPLPGVQPDTVGAYLDTWRARQHDHPHPHSGTDLHIQLNHPRGIHFFPDRGPLRGAWPLFNALGLDPDVPLSDPSHAELTNPEPVTGTTALDFDSVEVVNRFSLALYQELRRDWFALHDQGVWLTGTGNSDSHAMQVEVAGLTINLVRAPRPGLFEALDTPAFLDALSAGDAVVTTGPVVTLEVVGDDGRTYGPGSVAPAAGGAVLRARVQAASWIPVPELRIIHNGDVLHHEVIGHRPGAVLDLTRELDLPLDSDGWVLAEAGWPVDVTDPSGVQPVLGGDYGLVAPGYVPVGFTNAIRLDGDGDGTWRPPGL